MNLPSLVLFLFAAARTGNGAIYQDFNHLPTGISYDFIVAGGGTAGSVIANRLSEDPCFNVLVLEAGPSHEGVLNSEIPGLFLDLPKSNFDWNYTTIPQTSLNGRTLGYTRGHILGGSSSINGMMYTRGSGDDYNLWAAVTGDEGWSWKNMLHYILKNEHFISPTERNSTVGQYNPHFHNFTGMNYVSLPGLARPLDNAYVQTSKDLKDEFPFKLDMNDGNPIGLGWLQSTIKNGTRSSAATSYLGPQFINRRNLAVVLNTQISRVLRSPSAHDNIEFRTIEFKSATDQSVCTLTATKEVILSLGVVGTPHILLNSGIGDKSELKKIGIQPTLHIPSVGKNFSDHIYIYPSWFINMTIPPDNTTASLDQWFDSRSGPLSNGILNQVVWARAPNSSSIFKTNRDPAAGPHTPHYEFLMGFRPKVATDDRVLHSSVSVVTTASRGSVCLNSSNLFDAPLIDPAIMKEEIDVLLTKEALLSIKRFYAGPAWRNIILGPQGDFASVTDEESLRKFILDTSDNGLHGVGTAAMSPRDAEYGVVDPDLRLKRARGLRIVDASVMPFVPAAHTQAPTYAVAERAADLIKQAWLNNCNVKESDRSSFLYKEICESVVRPRNQMVLRC